MNTRRYPRTIREAFRDADYACAIERPIDPEDRIVLKACAVLAVAFVAIVAIWG